MFQRKFFLIMISLYSLNTLVNAQEFPMSEGAEIPENFTQEEVENLMTSMAKLEQTTDEAMPASDSVTILKSGEVKGKDLIHRGSGQASIIELADGAKILRLENFSVTNGPALHVILTSHPDPKRRGDIKEDTYIDLGKLKGNKGNQNYDIPVDFDVSNIGSLVIYCQPFHVIFSTATFAQ